MATLKESAQAYEPPKTLNIADLEKVSTDLDLKDGSGKDKDGEEFKYKYIVVKDQEYRVPGTVLGSLKAILEKMPNLKHFSVLKSGEGRATRYQVIPYSIPEENIIEK